MIDAREFLRQRAGRKARPKQGVYVDLTADRYQWLVAFARRKGLTKVEVVEAAIDELRRLERELDQTA